MFKTFFIICMIGSCWYLARIVQKLIALVRLSQENDRDRADMWAELHKIDTSFSAAVLEGDKGLAQELHRARMSRFQKRMEFLQNYAKELERQKSEYGLRLLPRS